jgi:porin
MGLKAALEFQVGKGCLGPLRTYRLCAALAFLIGLAGAPRADEIDPEPLSDAPVAEKAAPDDQPAPTPSTQAKEPASHVHEVNPAPRRSAREVVEEIWAREELTGDWRGLRKDLSDHGITIGLRLTQYFQDVTSGGANKNNEYGGKMDYRLHVDGQKAFGLWPGLSFDLHAETRWGQDIMADAGPITLPNTALLTPLPGNYSDSDITGLQVTQALMGGRVNVFAGKLNVVDLETALMPTTAYGQEGFSTINGLATAWTWLRFVNIAMYGGGAMVVNPERGMVEGALIAFGQSNVSTSWDIDDSFNDGVGFLGAWRFFWDLGDLPGNIIVAAGGATKGYQSMEASPFTTIHGWDTMDLILMLPSLSDNTKKPWAAVSYVYQELWRGDKDGKRKLYLIVGGSMADKNPSFARWNTFGSIEAIGPLSIRPADRMGFAGWYTAVNDDVKDLLGLVGVDVGDSWGLEFYYNLEINRWLHITGDLQLLQNANKRDDVAVVPGVRFVIDF